MQIPKPSDIAAKIYPQREKALEDLLKRCVAAINGMKGGTARVTIPASADGWVILRARSKLESVGWTVEHWKGSQLDPANDLIIHMPVGLAEFTL